MHKPAWSRQFKAKTFLNHHNFGSNYGSDPGFKRKCLVYSVQCAYCCYSSWPFILQEHQHQKVLMLRQLIATVKFSAWLMIILFFLMAYLSEYTLSFIIKICSLSLLSIVVQSTVTQSYKNYSTILLSN